MAIPSWLQDVPRAAQLLTRLSLESAAQASLIIKDGELWAYAGELPQPAATELVRIVTQSWASGRAGDLATFIRLNTVPGEHMLYATRLIDGMILAVVHNVDTPFSKIRTQAITLVRALSSPPVQEDEKSPARPEHTPERQEYPVWVNEYQEEPAIQIPPLFDDVPPPQTRQGQRTEGASTPRIPFITSVSQPMQIDSLLPNSDESPADSLADYEPVDASYCLLHLACTLVPRLPHHHLAGDIVSLLRRWCADLCLAYGWRLDLISAGTEHLSWVARVPPLTSPEDHIKIIRTQVSKKVFEHFPSLGRDNPSGDFWAPGYLVSGSPTLHDEAVVQAFINQVRQRQGFSK